MNKKMTVAMYIGLAIFVVGLIGLIESDKWIVEAVSIFGVGFGLSLYVDMMVHKRVEDILNRLLNT